MTSSHESLFPHLCNGNKIELAHGVAESNDQENFSEGLSTDLAHHQLSGRGKCPTQSQNEPLSLLPVHGETSWIVSPRFQEVFKLRPGNEDYGRAPAEVDSSNSTIRTKGGWLSVE